MKIIIDIPEETYRICKALRNFTGDDSSAIMSNQDADNINRLTYQVADGIVIEEAEGDRDSV